jgi:hypothetical protein
VGSRDPGTGLSGAERAVAGIGTGFDGRGSFLTAGVCGLH